MGITRKVTTLLGVIGSLAAVAPAGAQGGVTFAGSTQGCFGASCSVWNTASVGGLTFNSGSFSVITAPFTSNLGYAGIGNDASSNSLGSLLLSSAPYNYTGGPFSLFVQFTQPSSANTTYSAVLKGAVVTNPTAGGVTFCFNATGLLCQNTGVGSADRDFTYGGGTYTLHVDNVSVSPNSTQQITGYITNTVPEPSSMALLGTGLVGLVPMIRRRRK